MGGISKSRLGAVRMLIERAPDQVVNSLGSALGSGAAAAGPMAEVRELVSAEMTDRKVRAAVFAPLAPLCQGGGAPALPSNSSSILWRALKSGAPSSVAEARRATLAMRRNDGPPPIYDELCRRAAEGLRQRGNGFAEAVELFEAGDAGAVERLCSGLALAGLARGVMPRLSGWVRNMDAEAAAAVRLAFKDAVKSNPDAAPTFMEMIYGQLEEPWLVLRVISAVMDRPSDRYLASSEMAGFGERLLQDLETRIEQVQSFEPDAGRPAAVALARSIQIATIVISEFEQWLDIGKDGPWGKRLTKARKTLASSVEARLREAPIVVDEALPNYDAHHGRTTRKMPRLTADLDPAAVKRGYAALTLLSETRSSAAHGGFASARAKVIEELDKQIDLYAEDLIEALHSGEVDKVRTHAFIRVAADFLALVREPSAGEVVRRRASAA